MKWRVILILICATWWVCEGHRVFASDGIPRESENGLPLDSRQGRIVFSPGDSSSRGSHHRENVHRWLRALLQRVSLPPVREVTSHAQDNNQLLGRDWLRQVSPLVRMVTSRYRDGDKRDKRRNPYRRHPSYGSHITEPTVAVGPKPAMCQLLSQLIRSLRNDDGRAVDGGVTPDRRHYVIHPRTLGNVDDLELPTVLSDYQPLQNEGIRGSIVLKKYVHPMEIKPTSQLNDESLHQVESYDQIVQGLQQQPLSLLGLAESFNYPAQDLHQYPLPLLDQTESYDSTAHELHEQRLPLLDQAESYDQTAQELQQLPLPLLDQADSYNQPPQELYNLHPQQDFVQQSHVVQQIADYNDVHSSVTDRDEERYPQQSPRVRQDGIKDKPPLPSPLKRQLFFRRARPEGGKRQIRIHQCYFNPVSCFRK